MGLETGAIDPGEDYGNEGLSWQKDSSWGNYHVTTLHTYEPVVLENALMAGFMAMNLRLTQESVDDMRGQVIAVDLTNTLKFPATNAEKTITLPQMVNNTDYSVETEIVSADGPVEFVEIYGKALNAFKVCYSGTRAKWR